METWEAGVLSTTTKCYLKKDYAEKEFALAHQPDMDLYFKRCHYDAQLRKHRSLCDDAGTMVDTYCG
jgi:hypothetical protein